MKKYKVGYTTGVFDMFHVGHLNALNQAKEQCDYLIVGVSTDELVQEYKGRKTVIPFEDRMKIVSSIKCVDKVVAQTDIDKSKAWEELKFDAVFHGDDWKNTELYREIEAKLREVGVDMVYFPHTEGINTTLIIEEIKKR